MNRAGQRVEREKLNMSKTKEEESTGPGPI